MAMGEAKSGGCLCGAVRFTARDVPDTISICHCEMCRRWTGSALIEVSVPTDSITWLDETHIKRAASSKIAERGFCDQCGSRLFFRITEKGPFYGNTDLALGLFDDPDGFTLTHEIYIDQKPDCFSYAGTHRRLTRAECVEKFPLLDTI